MPLRVCHPYLFHAGGPDATFFAIEPRKNVATSGIYQYRRGSSDFFVRLVYNFRYQSPNILRTSWNSKMTWHLLVSYAFPRRESRVVKYINDDDAVSTRFTIDRWTDAFQLQWTAFSLPIKCEAEKLTSFENERSGRTR